MLTQAYLPLPGGAERQIASLVPLLAERGVEVHILTRRWNAALAPRDRLGGAEVYRLPVPGPKPLAALVYTLSALPLIQRLRPDVLHAHELLSPTTTALAAKRLFGIPVVAKVLRGGQLGDIDKLRRSKIGPLRLGKGRLRTIAAGVDRFAVISSEIDRELEGMGVPASKRVFLPNGVDCRRFAPADPLEKTVLRNALGLPPDALIAIYSGRMVPEKRVDSLLSLWPEIRRDCPQAVLLVCGTGPEERRLRDLAGDGVMFAGQVEDVAPMLRAADLFVLPSATEGLSNALLEGLACALPVVATAVGGSLDVIADGQNGRLVPAEDPQRLKDAILALLADPNLRLQMGQAGRASVQTTYALETTADRLAALYHAVSRAGRS
jgi:glycosyltransferase involved in cell wall biosynthesis